MEPVGYKGASVSRSPGAARCTWVPLGVLAEFCGRAPNKTHRQQMASVVFYPAMRLLFAGSGLQNPLSNRDEEKPGTQSGGYVSHM